MKKAALLAFLLGGLLTFAQKSDTVTLWFLNTDYSISVSRGGVNSNGATTYFDKYYATTTILTGGSTMATPTLVAADIVVEKASEFSVTGTFIASGVGWQGECSVSAPFVGCTQTEYYLGTPISTLIYTGTPVYIPFTVPATANPSATHSSSSSKGAIIGGVVGSIVFILAVFALLFFFRRRRSVDPLATIEDDRAGRGLDSPMVERSLPQVPFPSPSLLPPPPPPLPRQSLAESRPPGPSEASFNPYNTSGTGTESHTTTKPSEKSSKLAPFPDPVRMSGGSESRSTQAGSMVLGPPSPTSPSSLVPTMGPERSSTGVAGDGQDLRPELEVLRAQVAQLQRMVVPDAPPRYEG